MNPANLCIKPLDPHTAPFRADLSELDRVTACYTGNAQIINTVSEAARVISELRECSELAVDCEGVRLGRGGKLTLIQIGKNRGTVYLFDVLVLCEELFSIGMKELLESKTIAKYMYDCKGDSDSLYHEYGVKLTNVLDMQLFEYIVRPIAGRSFPPPRQPGHYRKPCVRGLSGAIKSYVKRHQIRRIGLDDFFLLKSAGEKVMKTEKTIWRYRPLSGGMIRYAALDIEMIWIIAESLKSYKTLSGVTLQKVKLGSEIFAGMRRDADIKPDDIYVRHPVLPSYVIPDVDHAGRIKAFPHADTQCNGCRRYFESSFVTQQDLCKDCVEIVRASRYR